MGISSPFIANLQPAIAIEPGQGSLHDPTMATEALAGIDLAPRNTRGDASLPQSLPTPRVVVPLIGVQFVRSLSWSSAPSFDRLNGIKRCLQHLGVMDIGSRQGYGERDSVSVGHNVALRARFAAIRWIRAGFGALCCTISTSVLNCRYRMTAVSIKRSCDRGICLARVAHEGGGLVGDSRCRQQDSGNLHLGQREDAHMLVRPVPAVSALVGDGCQAALRR